MENVIKKKTFTKNLEGNNIIQKELTPKNGKNEVKNTTIAENNGYLNYLRDKEEFNSILYLN